MRSFCALLMLAFATAAAQAQYTVLPATVDGVVKHDLMLTFLNNQVTQSYTNWQTNFATLTTPAAIAAYQTKQQGIINDSLGNFAGFPDPANVNLNAQVTGTIYKTGYKIEKVLMQTQPGFYQTGNLYIPTASQYAGQNPAVLMTTGHWSDSKAFTDMTKMCSLLALNGMVCLITDPIDQGERLESSSTWGVQSHEDAFVSNTLVGRNEATWMQWDNMRALDYLQSRTDIVNPSKLGVTGASGGGTQTAYLMAVDNRIKAAVPNSWVTTWKDVLTTKPPTMVGAMGAQDAEQCLFGVLGKGLEQTDFVLARAPSAVQISANTDDFFPFVGVQSTFAAAQQVFTTLGAADKVQLATDSGEGHGYHKVLRESAAAFFAKNLRGETKTITEPTISDITLAESRVTATGQVMDLPGAKTTYQLNVEYNQNVLAPARAAFWQNNSRAVVLNKISELADIRTLGSLPAATATDYGPISRTGYHIEKLSLKVDQSGGTGMYVPMLMFVPTATPTGAVLYVNDAGKSSEAGATQRLEQLALSGKVVLSLDLAGMGETAQTVDQIWGNPSEIGIDHRETTAANMLGESYVGIRAENILSSAQWLIGQEQANGISKVDLLTVGNNSGIPALHAAALDRQLFGTCTFENNLDTWTKLIGSPSTPAAPYNLQYQNVVNDALQYYDLTDLFNLVSPATPGDANRDGRVSFSDYVLLETNFGKSGSWAQGDFDGDGVITFKDYIVLERNFGQSSVPEPATLSLLACGALALLRRKTIV